MGAPTQQQLAVLDWMRRNPGVLVSEHGGWSAAWASNAAKEHMFATVYTVTGEVPALSAPRSGRTENEETPKCPRVTAAVLIARGWVERAEGRRGYWSLGADGREVLVRWAYRLEGFSPRLMNDRTKRPVKLGKNVLSRYGGRKGAELYLDWHRKRAAYHQRIAAQIEESLGIVAVETADGRRAWAEMAAGRRAARE